MDPFEKLGLKNPKKSQSVPDSVQSVPEMPSQLKIDDSRQARQERTLSYMAAGVSAVPKLSPTSSVVQPYARVDRDRHGRFQPGISGNPRGPEMGIVNYIRLMTDDGREMADMAIHAMRGWLPYANPETGQEQWMPVDPKSRLEAKAWLMDRGYGRAVQVVETLNKTEDTGNMENLTLDERRQLLRLQLKLNTKPALKLLESGDASPDTGSESRGSADVENT